MKVDLFLLMEFEDLLVEHKKSSSLYIKEH
jgi:hypothetical protein